MKTIKRNIIIPDWAAWIAQNQIGDWYAYEFAPVINDCDWIAYDGNEEILFTGPRYEKWKDTLQRI